MGGKSKYLIIILLLFTVTCFAQEKDFLHIDSVTYKFYLEESWEDLIREGEAAIESGTDYKHLRQRLGHAYFSKGDYLSARKHLKKALTYDSYDQFSLSYLYWANLNSGMEAYSGYIGKLLSGSKNEGSFQGFKPVI